MDQQIVDDNAISRRRLQDLVSRLDDAALRQMVDADWTVASVLYMLERSGHRSEHLDQIEATLDR